MQFIEKNSFNVRSVVYRLARTGSELEFLIFPMIHVGSKEFYQEISRRLTNCDVIVYEGVNSKRVALITLSYQIIKYVRRMDLVTQHDGMQLDGLRERIVNADIEKAAFNAGWSSLPLRFRALIFMAVPVIVVYLLLFGTRERIAGILAVNDLKSNEEVLETDEDIDRWEAFVLDERDRKLIDYLTKLEEKHDGSRQRVGVVYGARHMPAIVYFLMQKLGYRVVQAEWVKVFDL